MTQSSKYVVLKGSDAAGLGDRLLALCSALAYARLTGRTLSVDWRDGLYAEGDDNAFAAHFELKGISHIDEVPPLKTVAPPIWSGKLDWRFSDLVIHHREEHPWDRNEAHMLYAIDQGRFDYAEDAVVIWDYEQFPKMASLLAQHLGLPVGASEFQLRRQLLQTHLRPAPALQKLIDAFQRQLTPPVIGLHVRATEEGISRYADIEIFERFLETLTQRRRYGSIFVASDNIEIVERLRARWPIITTDKWYPPAWQPMHLAKDRPSKEQNLREALRDFYALASCHTLLHAQGSSFGQVAGLIGHAAPKNIFPLNNSDQCQSFEAYRRHARKQKVRDWLRRLTGRQ